jgi:hypothetical protein
MQPDATPSLAAKLPRKIGVSFALGALAFGLSTLIDAEDTPKFLIGICVSIFVGGITFATQFLIEVDQRVASVARELHAVESRTADQTQPLQAIREELARLNEALLLFGAVEKSPFRTDAIMQLVRNAITVGRHNPSLVFDFAQGEIARLSGYLKELGQGGDVTYDGEDRDWLLGLTRYASSSIDATSLATVDAGGASYVDGGLWTSELGKLYLEAQREATKRKVKIRRIFILDRPMEIDDRLHSVLDLHVAAGVEVRILLPTEVRHQRLFDFIIFDAVISYQSSLAPSLFEQSRSMIMTTTLINNPDRVAERRARFKDLWSAATPYTLAGGPTATRAP